MKRIWLCMLIVTTTIHSCDVVQSKNCIKIKNSSHINMVVYLSHHYPDTFLTSDNMLDLNYIVKDNGHASGHIVNGNDSGIFGELGKHYGDSAYWKKELSRDTLMIYFFDLEKIRQGVKYEDAKIKIMYLTFADFLRNKGVFYFDSTILY